MRHASALVIAAMATAASPALAQSTAPVAQPAVQTDRLEDIVVTAQRRRESVQNVPIAVSAFTQAELTNRGITQTLDIIQFVPNLFGSNNTGLGSANAYYIRGLGNTETIATFDPPVGTYVDDIYLSRQNANNLSLFDVERLEVLRGPQGTLYGRNTTGGAINVILREPGREFHGFVEGSVGRFNKLGVRGSVDIPLADSFAVKLSGFRETDDGYVRNTTTGQRLNDNDQWGARIGFRAELSDRVRWTGSYARLINDGENILNFLCDPANPTDCNGRFSTTGLVSGNVVAVSPYLPLAVSGRKALYGQGNRTALDLVTSNLQVGLSDSLTLNLITGYVNLQQQFALDFFDGRGGPSITVPNPVVRRFTRGGFTILNDGNHQQFTQEVKLNGKLFSGLVDFVTGFYYYDERNKTDFADVFSIFTGAPGGTGLLLGDRLLKNGTVAYAGYGQADLNLTRQFKLTAGVRYTDEKKTFNIRDNRAVCATVTGPTCLDNSRLVAANGVAIPNAQTTREWTPRFAANFQLNRDILFFASATRGFKSGGWNARATNPAQLLPFGPEKIWSYEVGAKTELLDRRLRVNITGYLAETGGLQTPSALIAPNGTITFITRNFADYENNGVEAEITAVPFEGLNLYVNAGYQDDKYKINANAPATDVYGIQSVALQQAACLAARAAGQIPRGANTAPAGTPPNNAPACAAGIVTADGRIAEPVRTPDWSLAIGGSYEAKFGGGFALIPSINATYRSKYETGTSGLSLFNAPVTGINGTYPANPFGNGALITGSQGSSYWLVNASLALTAREGRYKLSIECENCLDEEYVQSSLAEYTYFNKPATWTARLRAGF